MNEPLSLLELQTRIKEGIKSLFADNYQVVAEISEAKTNASGHCYLELVQRDENSNLPQAKAAATIWAYTYRMLKPYFESETGRSFEAGIKVLLTVQVQYHELYGLSLNVIDIDPTYTVGEIELQRRKTLQRLVDEGVFDMNKSLPMPLLPQRVAIISSPTAAGFQDFMNQLLNNQYGYTFRTQLFAATMQGKDAETSIISAINQINFDDFDVLVIIRGGGAISDLACFDSYALAFYVAQIPIPVITGIGHNKDVSVVDLIAHTSVKTPTAAAEFLIGCFAEQETVIDELSERLIDAAREHIENGKNALNDFAMQIKNLASTKIQHEKIFVNTFVAQRLKPLLAARFKEMNLKLQLYAKSVEAHNPQQILQRGYSIVHYKGKVVTSANSITKGDNVDLIFYEGNKKAIIE